MGENYHVFCTMVTNICKIIWNVDKVVWSNLSHISMQLSYALFDNTAQIGRWT